MFNKTIVNETRVTPVTQVIEKTITPDKVTEMYDKVRTEVEESFVRTFHIKSDRFNGVVVEMIRKFDTKERITMTRFVLNDKEHILKTFHQTDESLSVEELLDVFVEHYKSALANELVKEAASVILKNKA